MDQRSNLKQEDSRPGGSARRWGNALKRLFGIETPRESAASAVARYQRSEAAGYDAPAVQQPPGSEQNDRTGLGNPDVTVAPRDVEPEPAAPQAMNPNQRKAG